MTDVVDTISLLCGFVIIFSGVYLLNFSDGDGVSKPTGERFADGELAVSSGYSRARLASHETFRSSEETQYEDRNGLMRSHDAETDGYLLQDLSRDGEERVGERR